MENNMKDIIKRITGISLVIAFLVYIFVIYNMYFEDNNQDAEDEFIVQDETQKDNYLSTIMGEVYAPPGEIINEKSFQVFEVYTPHAALVRGKTDSGGYYGIVYLLVRDKYYYFVNQNSEFYDEQIVKVPKGKVVRMFGTYSYTTRDGRRKTVPRIMIVDN